jgi:SAM-dependent methyltransferase
VLVSGLADDELFLHTGADHARSVRYVFSKAGRPVETLERFLDFGCGCGRVTRHLIGLGPAIEGCDYNSTLVSWCRKHLDAATFTTNELRPPTSYPDGHFAGILALSVVTHMTVPSQQAWLAEWRRLLAPGGLLLFTAHGQRFRNVLAPDELTRFDRGEIVVRAGFSEGSNRCASFHPPGSVQAELLSGFELLDHIDVETEREDPERWNFGQDAYLLRRRDDS